jgi:hypothetical protein
MPFELLPLSAPLVRDAWHHVKVSPQAVTMCLTYNTK